MSDADHAAHELLLRWSGRMPIELIDTCLDLVRAGDDMGLAATVAHACLLSPVPITHHEAGLVAVVLDAAGVDSSIVSGRFNDRAEPGLAVEFAAAGLDQPDAPAIELDPAQESVDLLDKKAIGLIAALPNARGLWRVWRASPFNARWPAPGRTYLVEVASDDLITITGGLRDELRDAADGEPIEVLVYSAERQLGDYALTARASAQLIWADSLPQPLELVPIYGELAGETGPGFGDWTPVAAPDREELLTYLRSGALVLCGTDTSSDVLATGSDTSTVPMHLRTDGRLIWSDSTTYYLDRHGVPPQQSLRDQAIAANFQPPPVTGVDVYRALCRLRQHTEEELLSTLWGVETGPTSDDADVSRPAAKPRRSPRKTTSRTTTSRRTSTTTERSAKSKASVNL